MAPTSRDWPCQKRTVAQSPSVVARPRKLECDVVTWRTATSHNVVTRSDCRLRNGWSVGADDVVLAGRNWAVRETP